MKWQHFEKDVCLEENVLNKYVPRFTKQIIGALKSGSNSNSNNVKRSAELLQCTINVPACYDFCVISQGLQVEHMCFKTTNREGRAH